MIRIMTVNEERIDELELYKAALKDALHDICLLEEVLQNFFSLDTTKDKAEKKSYRDEIHELMEEYFSQKPIIDRITSYEEEDDERS